MTDTTASDWGNYWKGRAASEAGAALVGAGIETDSDIAAIWAEEFAGLTPDTRVLDLACGAGSALKAASAAGLTNLTGVDIAEEALQVMAREVPGATGVAAPADRTGLESASFDRVVSQFGLEYAGLQKAAREAARLLAPAAAFAAIIHLKDGAIARECSEKLAELNVIRDSEFIVKGQKLFRALFAADADKSQAAVDRATRAVNAFKPAMDAVQRLRDKQSGQSLASHLYDGTAQLYQRRATYALADIEGWLKGMAGEIGAYRGRMESMLASAQSEADIRAALDLFAAAGHTPEPPRQIALKDGEAPAAWWVRAGTPR